MPSAEASAVLHGTRLVVQGPLLRTEVAALWHGLPSPGSRVTQIDLAAVPRLDSAGLALVSLLLERFPHASLLGAPHGLDDLRAAYRLDERLAFAA